MENGNSSFDAHRITSSTDLTNPVDLLLLSSSTSSNLSAAVCPHVAVMNDVKSRADLTFQKVHTRLVGL
jgi:hypothetical protein